MKQHPELTRILLEKRGIKTAEEAEIFLRPDYERDLHDPFLLPDMEKAVVRIFSATEAREKIAVYADYDCDGLPGAAILRDFFRQIGHANVEFYIPDRNDEGYGLSMEAVRKLAALGAKILITVDLGISDAEEIAEAGALGLDVIVTDHHLPQAKLPRPYALINPKVGTPAAMGGASYPEKNLCGAGVAFKLVQALVKKYGEYWKIPRDWEKWLLDLAAIGTLSDMVPLLGENRALAYFGLKVLQKNRRLGLAEVWRRANTDARFLSEDDIAFTLAPRINAASRLDSPWRAFELLCASEPIAAATLAGHLFKINDERKILVMQIMREARAALERRLAGQSAREVVVLGNPKWRAGVLGLVAGRLCEELNRPVFVWGEEGGDGALKGSCRSGGSVNLVELMSALPAGTFADFGGHELSGGFSVSREQVHFLEDVLCAAYRGKRSDLEGAQGPTLRSDYDLRLSLSDVNLENWKQIESLAPFGVGNPKPVFLFENVIVNETRQFGKGKEHLELSFLDESGRKIKAIAFFSSPEKYIRPLVTGGRINLLASFELSRWNGSRELRLRVVDII